MRAASSSVSVASVNCPGLSITTAPVVVVSYTDDPEIAKKFAGAGLQIAAGIPLQCDEPDDFLTFRLGLFGLDTLDNVDRTVETLEKTLNEIL